MSNKSNWVNALLDPVQTVNRHRDEAIVISTGTVADPDEFTRCLQRRHTAREIATGQLKYDVSTLVHELKRGNITPARAQQLAHLIGADLRELTRGEGIGAHHGYRRRHHCVEPPPQPGPAEPKTHCGHGHRPHHHPMPPIDAVPATPPSRQPPIRQGCEGVIATEWPDPAGYPTVHAAETAVAGAAEHTLHHAVEAQRHFNHRQKHAVEAAEEAQAAEFRHQMDDLE